MPQTGHRHSPSWKRRREPAVESILGDRLTRCSQCNQAPTGVGRRGREDKATPVPVEARQRWIAAEFSKFGFAKQLFLQQTGAPLSPMALAFVQSTKPGCEVRSLYHGPGPRFARES